MGNCKYRSRGIVQVMRNFKNTLYILIIGLLLITSGCINEQFEDNKEENELVFVSFKPNNPLSTGLYPLNQFRVIVFNSAGTLEINKSQNELIQSKNGYKMSLRPGLYTMYGTANMSPENEVILSQVRSTSAIDDLTFAYKDLMSEKDLPVVWKKQIYVKSSGTGVTKGLISLDNKIWKDTLNMALERTVAKVSVSCRKDNPKQTILIQSIELRNLPDYTSFIPSEYPVAGKMTNLVSDFSSDPIDVTNKTGIYSTVLAEEIIPENRTSEADRSTSIILRYTKDGKSMQSEFPMGNIARNHFYQYKIVFTAVSVDIEKINVTPWKDNQSDEIIPEASISFSQINVPYSYTTPSKIYFTTRNIPESALTLLNVFANSDQSISSKFDMNQTKLNYSYDLKSKTGTGSLTVKRKVRTIANDLLVIQAADLKRTIRVGGAGMAGSNIYWDAALQRLAFDDVPPVGQTAPHEKYQGVPFFWGGLQAMPGGSQNETQSEVMDYVWCSTGDIQMKSPKLATDYTTLVNGKFPFKPNEGRGDVCLFMTRRGWAPPGNKWRIPNRTELLEFKSIVQEGEFLSFRPAPGYQPGYNQEGTSIVSTGLRLDSYFLPNSGYFRNIGPGLGYNPYVNSYTYYNIQDYAKDPSYQITYMYVLNKNRIGTEGLNTNTYFSYFVRCVVDDSPGEVIPLYMISYDLSNGDSNKITAPTPSGMILNQYADKGGALILSDVKLPDTNGLTHQGWIVNGADYALGATLSNITKDLVAKPKWGN